MTTRWSDDRGADELIAGLVNARLALDEWCEPSVSEALRDATAAIFNTALRALVTRADVEGYVVPDSWRTTTVDSLIAEARHNDRFCAIYLHDREPCEMVSVWLGYKR